MDDISVLNLFIEAGLVVKLVMIILLIASLLTWIVIFERYNFFRDLKKTNSDITENLCLPDNKLFYDYKNHLFTDKQIDKVYSIFHLTVFFIYDIKKIVAPKNYKKSILNCKERFVLTSCNIQWGIREWSGAHQTILLYDNKRKSVNVNPI